MKFRKNFFSRKKICFNEVYLLNVKIIIFAWQHFGTKNQQDIISDVIDVKIGVYLFTT